MSMFPEWPDVQDMIRRVFDEVGYVSIKEYFRDARGRQIARFNMVPEDVEKWLRVDPGPFGIETTDGGGVEALLDQPIETLPQREKPLRGLLGPETGGMDLDAEDFDDEDLLGHLGGDDEDDEDDDEIEEDDDEGIDASTAAAQGINEIAFARQDYLDAIRLFLLTTMRDNTPAGESGRFRLALITHKGGRQIGSKVLSYKPAGVQTPVADPLSQMKSALADSLPTPRPTVTAKTGHQIPAPGNYPSPPPPIIPPPPGVKTNLPQKSNGHGRIDIARTDAEIDTLREMMPLYVTGFVDEQFRSMAELHEAYRRIVGMQHNASRLISEVYANALSHLAGALSDSRTTNNNLVDTLQSERLAVREQEVTVAQNLTKRDVQRDLGSEAMRQIGGVITQAIKMKANRAPEPAMPPQYDPASPAPPGADYQPIGSIHGGVDPDGYDGYAEPEPPPGMAPAHVEEHMTPEPSDEGGHEWIFEREDALDALGDPNVKNFLADPDNVKSLKNMARVFGGGDDSPLNPTFSGEPEPDPDPEPLHGTVPEMAPEPADTEESDE